MLPEPAGGNAARAGRKRTKRNAFRCHQRGESRYCSGVPDRLLDVLVPEVVLQRPRIVTVVREPTGMAKHVGVDREWHLGGPSQPETIPSCDRRSRRAKFQPHRWRHLRRPPCPASATASKSTGLGGCSPAKGGAIPAAATSFRLSIRANTSEQ